MWLCAGTASRTSVETVCMELGCASPATLRMTKMMKSDTLSKHELQTSLHPCDEVWHEVSGV